jgi:predicted short-subunit dehydrogenase-like oxidoreductase (DUF2520 family)
MLPAMAAKPTIAIVGPGRLGRALALALNQAGYTVCEVISRNRRESRRTARVVARAVGAHASTTDNPILSADLIWLCVPDRDIANVSRQLSERIDCRKKIAFHSSGALSSDEMSELRRRGAAVASVHPLMTFVSRSMAPLAGVPFAVEGQAFAVRAAKRIVRDLGGEAFPIRKTHKAAYHAWGAFASPLLLATLVTAEQMARTIGLSAVEARRRMLPIIRQTLANYEAIGPAGAFSGPIVRGDAETVRQHLRTLNKIPEMKDVYRALARTALRYLPTQNRGKLKKVLK